MTLAVLIRRSLSRLHNVWPLDSFTDAVHQLIRQFGGSDREMSGHEARGRAPTQPKALNGQGRIAQMTPRVSCVIHPTTSKCGACEKPLVPLPTILNRNRDREWEDIQNSCVVQGQVGSLGV